MFLGNPGRSILGRRLCDQESLSAADGTRLYGLVRGSGAKHALRRCAFGSQRKKVLCPFDRLGETLQ